MNASKLFKRILNNFLFKRKLYKEQSRIELVDGYVVLYYPKKIKRFFLGLLSDQWFFHIDGLRRLCLIRFLYGEPQYLEFREQNATNIDEMVIFRGSILRNYPTRMSLSLYRNRWNKTVDEDNNICWVKFSWLRSESVKRHD